MAAIEIVLLAFFLIFLVLILMKMDRSYRDKQQDKVAEASRDLDRIVDDRHVAAKFNARKRNS